MDSGSSGSMQSSSGGDDQEFDSSRSENISPFFNFGPNSTDHHPPQRHQSHHSPIFFDTPPQNPIPFSHPNPNPNSNSNTTTLYNNPDSVWSRPNNTLTSLPSSSTQPLLRAPQSFPTSSSSSVSITMPVPQVDGNNGGRAQNVAVKGSRKRTRASRRAPTTVLTTDTANFRQMVQEFTGIPSPPFSAAATSSYSRRFDLFGPGSALGPLYPFRPSVQRAPILPTSDLSYVPKQPQALLNPVLSFQNLVPSPALKYPGQANVPSLAELGMSHGQVGSGSDLIGGFQTSTIAGANRLQSSGIMGNDDHLGLGSFDGKIGGDSQSPVDGGFKLNCLASTTSKFHPEKGLENVFLKE